MALTARKRYILDILQRGETLTIVGMEFTIDGEDAPLTKAEASWLLRNKFVDCYGSHHGSRGLERLFDITPAGKAALNASV
jgi:hypothetical protein